MNYTAHRIVIAPYQMQANTLLLINEQGEWEYKEHHLQHEEWRQTIFYNGILFPSFPSILSPQASQELFKQLQENHASIQESLEQLCYLPWQEAIRKDQPKPQSLWLLEDLDWKNQSLQACSKLQLIIG